MYARRAGRCVGRPRACPSPLDLEGQVSIPPRPAAASQPAAAPSGSCGVASAAPSTSGSRAPVPARIASQAWRAGGGWGLGDFSLCTLLPTHAALPLMAEEHPADAAPPTTPPAADAAPRVTAEEHPADAAPPTTPPAADAAPRVAAEEQRNAAIITNPLHDDNLLEKILVRLPGAACLSRAVLVSHRWCRVISDEGFLRRFRDRHPSSPLLGGFVDIKDEHVPRLQTGVANVHKSNPFIVSAMRHTDVLLTRLDGARRWCLRDCRNGRLLFARAGGAMCIYDPLSGRRVPIGTRIEFDDGCKCLGDCLLELDGLARHTVTVEQRGQQVQAQESFRVISLQLQSHSRCNVRAVEYNSGTLQWRLAHPQTGWTKVQLTKLQRKPMYAAGHIFWQTDAARLLVLDTSTMGLSEHAVPGVILPTVREGHQGCWAIGELRDGKGCLVGLQGGRHSSGKDGSMVKEEPLRLEVWAMAKEEGAFCWKREKDVWLSEMIPKAAGANQVHKVINGLALIGCAGYSYAIDLQSMTLLARFESGGDVVYPYQMSWPPAVLAAATGVVSRHLGPNLSDEDNVQIPSKNMDGREGTSSGGSESGNNTLEKNTISDEMSTVECHLAESGNNTLEKNTISDEMSTVECHLAESGNNTLEKNTISDEMSTVECHLAESGNNTLEKNTISDEMSTVECHLAESGNNTLEKNTISDEMSTVECHLALSRNGSSETRSNAISSPMHKRPFACHVDGCAMSYDSMNNLPRHSWEVYEQKKHSARRFTGCSEEFSSNNKRKIHEGSSAHVELSANKIKCVSIPPAGGPEAHEELRPTQVVAHRTSNRRREPNKLVSGDDWVI